MRPSSEAGARHSLRRFNVQSTLDAAAFGSRPTTVTDAAAQIVEFKRSSPEEGVALGRGLLEDEVGRENWGATFGKDAAGNMLRIVLIKKATPGEQPSIL